MLQLVSEQYDSHMDGMEYGLFGPERIAQLEREDLDRYHRSILKTSRYCDSMDDVRRSKADEDAYTDQETINEVMLQFRDEAKSEMAELKSQLGVIISLLQDLNSEEETPILPTPRAANEIDALAGPFPTELQRDYVYWDSVEAESNENPKANIVTPYGHNLFAEMPRHTLSPVDSQEYSHDLRCQDDVFGFSDTRSLSIPNLGFNPHIFDPGTLSHFKQKDYTGQLNANDRQLLFQVVPSNQNYAHTVFDKNAEQKECEYELAIMDLHLEGTSSDENKDIASVITCENPAAGVVHGVNWLALVECSKWEHHDGLVLDDIVVQKKARKVFTEMLVPILEKALMGIEFAQAAYNVLDERSMLLPVNSDEGLCCKMDSPSSCPYIIETRSSDNGNSWVISQNLSYEDAVVWRISSNVPPLSKQGFNFHVFDPGTLILFKHEDYESQTNENTDHLPCVSLVPFHVDFSHVSKYVDIAACNLLDNMSKGYSLKEKVGVKGLGQSTSGNWELHVVDVTGELSFNDDDTIFVSAISSSKMMFGETSVFMFDPGIGSLHLTAFAPLNSSEMPGISPVSPWIAFPFVVEAPKTFVDGLKEVDGLLLFIFDPGISSLHLTGYAPLNYREMLDSSVVALRNSKVIFCFNLDGCCMSYNDCVHYEFSMDLDIGAIYEVSNEIYSTIASSNMGVLGVVVLPLKIGSALLNIRANEYSVISFGDILGRAGLFWIPVSSFEAYSVDLASRSATWLCLLPPLKANFGWDLGICVIFAYILEDKDDFKQVGNRILAMLLISNIRDGHMMVNMKKERNMLQVLIPDAVMSENSIDGLLIFIVGLWIATELFCFDSGGCHWLQVSCEFFKFNGVSAIYNAHEPVLKKSRAPIMFFSDGSGVPETILRPLIYTVVQFLFSMIRVIGIIKFIIPLLIKLGPVPNFEIYRHNDKDGCEQDCILHYLPYAAATLKLVMRDFEPCELIEYQNQLMDAFRLRSNNHATEMKFRMLYVRRISTEPQQLSSGHHSVSFLTFQNPCCVLGCFVLMFWLVGYKGSSYGLGSYTILALGNACLVNFYLTSNMAHTNVIQGAENGVVQNDTTLRMWLQIRNEDFGVCCLVFGAHLWMMSSVQIDCLLLKTMPEPFLFMHRDHDVYTSSG